MSSYCSKCHAPLRDGASFCPQCGAKVETFTERKAKLQKETFSEEWARLKRERGMGTFSEELAKNKKKKEEKQAAAAPPTAPTTSTVANPSTVPPSTEPTVQSIGTVPAATPPTSPPTSPPTTIARKPARKSDRSMAAVFGVMTLVFFMAMLYCLSLVMSGQVADDPDGLGWVFIAGPVVTILAALSFICSASMMFGGKLAKAQP